MLSLAPFLQLTNQITEIGAIVDEDPPNKVHVRETRIRGGVTFGCFLPCPWTHPSLISYNHSVSQSANQVSTARPWCSLSASCQRLRYRRQEDIVEEKKSALVFYSPTRPDAYIPRDSCLTITPTGAISPPRSPRLSLRLALPQQWQRLLSQRALTSEREQQMAVSPVLFPSHCLSVSISELLFLFINRAAVIVPTGRGPL